MAEWTVKRVPVLARGAIMALALAGAACASSPPPTPSAPFDAATPAAELDPPERALRDRIASLLDERLGADARGIRVHVDGTSVWLTGTAPDRWARDRARAVAHEVPGVTRVDTRGLGVH